MPTIVNNQCATMSLHGKHTISILFLSMFVVNEQSTIKTCNMASIHIPRTSIQSIQAAIFLTTIPFSSWNKQILTF